VLGSSDFDKIKVLYIHKCILEKSLDWTEKLIKTIDKTINHLRDKQNINPNSTRKKLLFRQGHD